MPASKETNEGPVFPHRTALILALTLLSGARSATAHPAWGIVVDPRGRVVFSEVTTNSVWRVEDDGSLTRLVSGRHSHELFQDDRGVLSGEHVTYDAAGDRWVRTAWRWVPPGLVETSGASKVVLPMDPVSGLAAVNARAWGPDGRLYVTDGAAVRRVEADGTITTLGGNPFAGISHGEHPRLLGLAVNLAGGVLVADADHGLVRQVTRRGKVIDLWRSGPFWSPAGVAIDNGDGSVYILESRPENLLMLLERIGPWARVRKVDQDGRITVLALVGDWSRARLAGLIAVLAAGALVWLRRRTAR